MSKLHHYGSSFLHFFILNGRFCSFLYSYGKLLNGEPPIIKLIIKIRSGLNSRSNLNWVISYRAGIRFQIVYEINQRKDISHESAFVIIFISSLDRYDPAT